MIPVTHSVRDRDWISVSALWKTLHLSTIGIPFVGTSSIHLPMWPMFVALVPPTVLLHYVFVAVFAGALEQGRTATLLHYRPVPRPVTWATNFADLQSAHMPVARCALLACRLVAPTRLAAPPTVPDTPMNLLWLMAQSIQIRRFPVGTVLRMLLLNSSVFASQLIRMIPLLVLVALKLLMTCYRLPDRLPLIYMSMSFPPMVMNDGLLMTVLLLLPTPGPMPVQCTQWARLVPLLSIDVVPP